MNYNENKTEIIEKAIDIPPMDTAGGRMHIFVTSGRVTYRCKVIPHGMQDNLPLAGVAAASRRRVTVSRLM